MRRIFVLVITIVIIFKSVSLAGKFYTSEDFKNIFLKEVESNLSWVKGKFYAEKIRIEPESVVIPKPTPYRVIFINPPKIGLNLLILEFKKGKTVERVKIWGYVDAKIPVVVLRRPVLNKAILTEKDVTIALKPLSRLPQDAIFDKSSVIGKEVRMSLEAGTVLRYSQIEVPVVIKKNQIVYIVARGRNFVVKAKGIALQDGRKGEIIKVKNLSSKKVLWGKVISSKEVEVSI